MEKDTHACPKCGSHEIQFPNAFIRALFAESGMMGTVMKMHLGFLYGPLRDSLLRDKCKKCGHKW